MTWCGSVSIRSMSARSDARRLARTDDMGTWLAFPELAGTHLTWRRAGMFSVDLLDPTGHTWVSVKCPPSYSRRGAVINAHGRTYETRTIGRSKDQCTELVDTRNNATMMTMTGIHYAGTTSTRVHTPDGLSLTFPVKGSESTATMSAVDDAGHWLIRYRVNRPSGGV